MCDHPNAAPSRGEGDATRPRCGACAGTNGYAVGDRVRCYTCEKLTDPAPNTPTPSDARVPECCAACHRVARERAHDFHPERDVGPWDDACPACRHICGSANVADGTCSTCASSADPRVPEWEEHRAKAFAAFSEYMTANYSPGCVISDPAWHARRIFRAALHALGAMDLHRQALAGVEAREDAERWRHYFGAEPEGRRYGDDTPQTRLCDALANALNGAWNDFVTDTGCYPDCIQREPRGRLSADFAISNFALFAAGRLRASLLARTPHLATGGSDA